MATLTQRKRSEVPVEETWDLTAIYADDKAWEEAFKEVSGQEETVLSYRGRLAESADTLYSALMMMEDLGCELGKLASYAMHASDADTADQDALGRKAKLMQVFASLQGAMAYFEPEAAKLSEETVSQFMEEKAELKDFRHYFAEMWRVKKHQLSEKEEVLLAKASQIFNDPNQTFDVLSDTDMTFPEIKDEKGRTVEMSHARFGTYMESRDRRVRRDAFSSMYDSYGQFRNTCAQTLAGQIRVNTYIKDVRGFASGREAALFENNIPESVYDSLLEAVNARLPLLHRYVSLRKKIMGLDEIHSYDLYAPLVKDIDLKFSFEEAQEIILKALQPLGPEYLAVLKRAFSERWVDYADNAGKRSGAYSGGAYKTRPYILMSWQGTMDNVFTLAHELGHSLHSWFTRESQPYQYGDYCIFLAEIASTTNENLLTEYLLKTAADDKMKAAVINHYLDGFKGTVFRQTQFAEFEYMIHQADENGIPLTASYLTENYGALNRHYYGADLTFDEAIALEWARIPHFYYNYYVFQYATGFSAATAFAEMIREEGQPAVERYLNFLKAGSSDWPIEVLQTAGVDMTKPDPILKALDTFEAYLEEFERVML
ncbi:MAG: oligoendopeptidase F [Clostridiaceae bacterium]|nr:oligoendopeptidase F [Clostridiaceae bacterium]